MTTRTYNELQQCDSAQQKKKIVHAYCKTDLKRIYYNIIIYDSKYINRTLGNGCKMAVLRKIIIILPSTEQF